MILYIFFVVNDWMTNFEAKVTPFATIQQDLLEEEANKLGKKNIKAYPLFTIHYTGTGTSRTISLFSVILLNRQNRQ